MIALGIALIVIGVLMISLRGILVPALRDQVGRGFGPTPSATAATLMFVAISCVVIAFGVVVLVIARSG